MSTVPLCGTEPDGRGIHVDVCAGGDLMQMRQEAGSELITLVSGVDCDTAEAVRKAVKGEADGTLGRRTLTQLVRDMVREVMAEHCIDAA